MYEQVAGVLIKRSVTERPLRCSDVQGASEPSDSLDLWPDRWTAELVVGHIDAVNLSLISTNPLGLPRGSASL